MMKLSIYRCAKCSKIRLVDRVGEDWVCFACKQNVKRKPVEEPKVIQKVKKLKKIKVTRKRKIKKKK